MELDFSEQIEERKGQNTCFALNVHALMFRTKEAAEQAAKELGLSGTHEMTLKDGTIMHMPGETHEAMLNSPEIKKMKVANPQRIEKNIYSKDQLEVEILPSLRQKRTI